MKIGKFQIELGESKRLNLPIARLSSGTQISLSLQVHRSDVAGPTLVLLGGLHGDEVNGVEIVRRVIADKIGEKLVRGTLICIPLINEFGFINFSRVVPDGKDINRAFPGSKNGSLAGLVAHHISKDILSIADYVIDFHTGGSTRYNYPQVRYAPNDEAARSLGKAFGAPFNFESNLIPKSLRAAGHKKGVPVVVFEGGESLRYDPISIQHANKGIRRCMKYLKMLPNKSEHISKSIVLKSARWVRAPRSGLFTWHKQSGQEVAIGEVLGEMHGVDGSWNEQVICKKAGYIFGHNNSPVLNKGDALFHIGYL